MKQQKSVIEMEESQLIKAMQEHCTELTEDLAKKCIIRLSLDKRENYLTPPVGLAGKDIFPWSYNRELSYLRRPVIRYQYDDGTVMCMFGSAPVFKPAFSYLTCFILVAYVMWEGR